MMAGFRAAWLFLGICMAVDLGAMYLACAALEGMGAGKAAKRDDAYDDLIYAACAKYMPARWDWLILKALIKQESGFDPGARNGDAVGLLQFTASTAKMMGLPPAKRDDPSLAVPAGARYLRRLLDTWRGIPGGPPRWERTRFALASYNAGPGRVRRAYEEAGKPRRFDRVAEFLPSHTRRHVERVMNFFKAYRASGKYRPPARARVGRRGGKIKFWSNPLREEAGRNA